MNNASAYVSRFEQMQYLKNRWHDLSVLTGALVNKDFETVQRIGHNISGNSSLFGFDEFSNVGSDLESAGLSEDYERTAQVLSQYEKHLKFTSTNFQKK